MCWHKKMNQERRELRNEVINCNYRIYFNCRRWIQNELFRLRAMQMKRLQRHLPSNQRGVLFAPLIPARVSLTCVIRPYCVCSEAISVCDEAISVCDKAIFILIRQFQFCEGHFSVVKQFMVYGMSDKGISTLVSPHEPVIAISRLFRPFWDW